MIFKSLYGVTMEYQRPERGELWNSDVHKLASDLSDPFFGLQTYYSRIFYRNLINTLCFSIADVSFSRKSFTRPRELLVTFIVTSLNELESSAR